MVVWPLILTHSSYLAHRSPLSRVPCIPVAFSNKEQLHHLAFLDDLFYKAHSLPWQHCSHARNPTTFLWLQGDRSLVTEHRIYEFWSIEAKRKFLCSVGSMLTWNKFNPTLETVSPCMLLLDVLICLIFWGVRQHSRERKVCRRYVLKYKEGIGTQLQKDKRVETIWAKRPANVIFVQLNMRASDTNDIIF